MGNAISTDLRRRLVDAYGRGAGTYAELARLFGVGEATVSRVLRRQRERGTVEPDEHGGGMPARIADEELATLREMVMEAPDRTVEELRREWRRRHRTSLSRSSMLRALRRANLTWKKNGSDPRNKLVWTFTIAESSSSAGPRGSRPSD